MGTEIRNKCTGIKVWYTRLSYNPTGTGMIERYNGLLKSGLKSDTNCQWGWSVHLQMVLRRLNQKPHKGALSPVDILTYLAASPIQLYVQTKEELLKPGCGQQSNILLLVPTVLKPQDC